MKARILIIEDNYHKFFSTKQLLEARLHLQVEVVNFTSEGEIPQMIRSLKPDSILYKPTGCIIDIMQNLQKRSLNRRNAMITLMVTSEPISNTQPWSADRPVRAANSTRS